MVSLMSPIVSCTAELSRFKAVVSEMCPLLMSCVKPFSGVLPACLCGVVKHAVWFFAYD